MGFRVLDSTKRFLHCLGELLNNGGVKSQTEFAELLGIQAQAISEIKRGRRNVTLGMLEKAVEVFRFNPCFLFWGEGAPFLQPEEMAGLRILSVVINEDGEERILHVPVPAQAGYASGMLETEYIRELPTFTLPDETFKMGTHRCFDVAGDSMEPTLYRGDRVVCSFLEPDAWKEGIKDGDVYVIVTYRDVLVKRVVNLIAHNGSLELRSDNAVYKPITLPVVEVKELWRVRLKMSSVLSQQISDLERIEQQLQELKHLILRKQGDGNRPI